LLVAIALGSTISLNGRMAGTSGVLVIRTAISRLFAHIPAPAEQAAMREKRQQTLLFGRDISKTVMAHREDCATESPGLSRPGVLPHNAPN
jgi:hypothetical protein